MQPSRHFRLTDLELAELRALEGHVAIAAAALDKAREYAQHRLRKAVESRGIALDATSSWQLDSETGLVVDTTQSANSTGAAS